MMEHKYSNEKLVQNEPDVNVRVLRLKSRKCPGCMLLREAPKQRLKGLQGRFYESWFL